MTLMMPERLSLVRGFRLLAKLGIAEEPPGSNAGNEIEAIQRSTGNKRGDPWCASAVSLVGRTMLETGWPVPNTASCDVMLEWARKFGRLRETPELGALFLVMKSVRDATHVGVVESAFTGGSFRTLEGNAADPTKPATREGTGAFEGRVRGTHNDLNKYLFVWWWMPYEQPPSDPEE